MVGKIGTGICPNPNAHCSLRININFFILFYSTPQPLCLFSLFLSVSLSLSLGGFGGTKLWFRWLGLPRDCWVGLNRWLLVGFEMEMETLSVNVPEDILRSINFDALEGALNIKFNNRGLLVEAITHGSQPSSSSSSEVPCYKRLELIGDAILADLITTHLFFLYKDLPPGRLTDLRAASVNNEYFARVAVKNNLHVHLRHASTALQKQVFFLYLFSFYSLQSSSIPVLSSFSGTTWNK